MRSFKCRTRQILTVEDLVQHSFTEPKPSSSKKRKTVYVDVSPPCEESLPSFYKNFEFWGKGRKEDYESRSSNY